MEQPWYTRGTRAFLPHQPQAAQALHFVGKQKNPDKLFVSKIYQRDIYIFLLINTIPAFVHIYFLSDLY